MTNTCISAAHYRENWGLVYRVSLAFPDLLDHSDHAVFLYVSLLVNLYHSVFIVIFYDNIVKFLLLIQYFIQTKIDLKVVCCSMETMLLVLGLETLTATLKSLK